MTDCISGGNPVVHDELNISEKAFEGLAVCICDYYKFSLQVVKFCRSLLCILKQYIGAFQALLNNCFLFHKIEILVLYNSLYLNTKDRENESVNVIAYHGIVINKQVIMAVPGISVFLHKACNHVTVLTRFAPECTVISAKIKPIA